MNLYAELLAAEVGKMDRRAQRATDEAMARALLSQDMYAADDCIELIAQLTLDERRAAEARSRHAAQRVAAEQRREQEERGRLAALAMSDELSEQLARELMEQEMYATDHTAYKGYTGSMERERKEPEYLEEEPEHRPAQMNALGEVYAGGNLYPAEPLEAARRGAMTDAEIDALGYEGLQQLDEPKSHRTLSDAEFEALPVADAAGAECPVCLCGDDEMVTLPCMHRVHTECARKWLCEEKAECPTCKAVVE